MRRHRRRPWFHVKHRVRPSPFTRRGPPADLAPTRRTVRFDDRADARSARGRPSTSVAGAVSGRRGSPACRARDAHPGHRGRQPEGRRRQDHLDGERRRRAGPARPAGPGDRPRPAGQRLDRAGGGAPPRRAVDVRRARRRRAARRGRAAAARRSTASFVVPGDHRPGRRRDRAGQRGGPREPAAQGDRTRHPLGRSTRPARTASTTSSSTARRRSGCSRSTRWSPATRC